MSVCLRQPCLHVPPPGLPVAGCQTMRARPACAYVLVQCRICQLQLSIVFCAACSHGSEASKSIMRVSGAVERDRASYDQGRTAFYQPQGRSPDTWHSHRSWFGILMALWMSLQGCDIHLTGRTLAEHVPYCVCSRLAGHQLNHHCSLPVVLIGSESPGS